MKNTIVILLALIMMVSTLFGCRSTTEPTPSASPMITASPNVSDNPNKDDGLLDDESDGNLIDDNDDGNIIDDIEDDIDKGEDKLESAVPKMADRDETTENRKTSEKTY